jgi:hypothetical protein
MIKFNENFGKLVELFIDKIKIKELVNELLEKRGKNRSLG